MKSQNPDEQAVQTWASRIARDLEAWPEQSQPFGKVKLPKAEVFAKWQQNRNKPEYWQGLLKEGRTPQELLEYDRKMQEMVQDGAE